MDELNDSSYLRRPALRVKNNRSCSATTCGILQIVTYVLLMALTIFYLAYFAYTNDKLKKNSSGSDCLFFAKSDDRLGPSGTCSFFMGGSGVSIGLLFILILLGIFSTLCGKWSLCLKSFEIFVLSLAVILNISFCLVMTIGYHISCSKFENHCNSGVFNSAKVHEKMSVIEPIAWITTGALIIVSIVQLLSCVCICYHRTDHSHEDATHMYDEKRLLENKTASKMYS